MARHHSAPFNFFSPSIHGGSMRIALPVTPIPQGYRSFLLLKQVSLSRFRERASHLSPTGLHFVVFTIAKEPRISVGSHRSHFSCMTQHSKWITNEDENPNFSTSSRQFSYDLRFGSGIWSDATEIAWSGGTVNVQLYKENGLF
ncbi:hypothetical protein AVEN_138158-1 [Araneus ventricosus]|uniref:Uncharacterized protein n=1 Tax=Araneus ventricosus TaxID=182803 RepID=A0A4Y2LX80_ARAVE|nr:hypothetical protein AVEN_138158-1 [Araneus ventricosus]